MATSGQKKFSPAYLVVALVAVIYLPAVFNDFVEWDDTIILVHNPKFNPPTFHSVAYYWTHTSYNLYQPMTCTLWAALAKLAYVETPDQFGSHLNPYLFHLASVVLHACAAGMLFAILKRIFRSSPAAVCGALAFAIHPIQVEATAFIGAMNNPLFGLLALIAMWNYIRWREGGGRRMFWAGAVSLVLACLAKPTAIVVPPILLVMDVAVFSRPWRLALRAVLPWLLLTIPCVAWTLAFQKGSANAHISPLFRPVLAGDVLTLYLWKILVPMRLCIDYGWNPVFIQTRSWGYVLWIVTAGLAFAGWMIRRKSWLPMASLLILIIALLPNSGLASFDYQSISNVADRYAYFAMIGGALLIAWAVLKYGRPATVVSIAVMLIWVVQTEYQIQTWRNGDALFRHAIMVNPGGWLAPTNLSFIVRDQNRTEAEALCRTAIANAPGLVQPKNALASLLANASPDESIRLSRQALAIHADNSEAYNNLGAALWAKGSDADAIQAFQLAVKLEPDNSTFRKNLVAAEASYRTHSNN